MFKTLLNKTKRSFSQTASELGKVHPTVSLEEKSSKFFELVPLKGLKEALEAPEGAVAVTRPGPIQYELRK